MTQSNHVKYGQKFFRENLNLGEGGEEGESNRLLLETFERTGAYIMGKNMFDGGERAWSEEAPQDFPHVIYEGERI